MENVPEKTKRECVIGIQQILIIAAIIFFAGFARGVWIGIWWGKRSGDASFLTRDDSASMREAMEIINNSRESTVRVLVLFDHPPRIYWMEHPWTG
jgi:hypothetical protein